ncbi:MAG: hypothetical protein V4693_22745 [Pseudomonadota bacterium]
MQKRDAPSKKVQFLALVVIVLISATIIGCRGEKPAAPVTPAAQVTAPTAQPRSKEQAMAALMALPELKAWSAQLEKSSGGKVRGALIEYDPAPKLIDGKRYFQLSFVENGPDAAHRWESFLVADSGNDILVEDAATDKTMTLEQWRKDKHPMARTSAF